MEEILFENEIAKPIFSQGYYVTKSGKIVSVKVRGGQGRLDYNNPFELKSTQDRDGYLQVCLSHVVQGKQKRVYKRVHRLVWEAFNGVIPNDLTVDHINSVTTDNRLENLQLLTREDNTSKAKKGTIPWQKGKKHTSRNIYKLYINNEYVGNFDKKELKANFNLSRYDIDDYSKLTKNKIKNNIRLEKV